MGSCGNEVVMVKLTAIFPGQGAQKVGMGKDLYDNNEKARELLKERMRYWNFPFPTFLLMVRTTH